MRFSLFIAMAFLLAACTFREEETPLARVDDARLTLEEVLSQLDTTRGVSETQIREYVQRWFANEILYREAERRGLASSRRVEEKVAEIRRQLIIQEFLEQEIYARKDLEMSEDSLRNFYRRNTGQYLLTTDANLISFAVFAYRDTANAFRNMALETRSWPMAVDAFLPRTLMSAESVYVTPFSFRNQELWRVANGFKKREPSFPVAAEDGYYVMITWKSLAKGTPADYEQVADEIRNRFLIEQRKRQYDSLLTELKKRHSVEILPHAFRSAVERDR